MGPGLPSRAQPVVPYGTATATQELLKTCVVFFWGGVMKEKRSVGELLPFLWDYFYADNLGFLDSL